MCQILDLKGLYGYIVKDALRTRRRSFTSQSLPVSSRWGTVGGNLYVKDEQAFGRR